MNLKNYNSPSYRAWKNMKNRCEYKKSKQFKDYGGRGISYHPSWKLFENFIRDMGDRPSKDHSLDRIDNNGNYCKENCRWATKSEQSLNKRIYKRTKSNLAGTRKRTNGKWVSQISINGLKYHLGTYETEEEAHERFLQERAKRQST